MLTTFIDHIGRTMIGEVVESSSSETHLVVKNPAIVHVQPVGPNSQLSVQVIPLYFREFVSEKNKVDGTLWSFPRVSIVLGINVENDGRLVGQYGQVFNTQPQPPTQTEPKIVKLFDN